MNKEEFHSALSSLGLNLTQEQDKQLEIYAHFLQEYNKHTNLTAITDLEEIYLKHFYDSITIIKAIDLKNKTTLLDIGTGAGFPGMVLKIVFPHLSVTLLDSNQKKLQFLEELSHKLNLTVTLIHERAEDYIKDYRESFDVVTSRAVANLRVLSELAIPFVKVNHHFIAMKGNTNEEILHAQDILNKLDAKITSIEEFTLPKEESTRMLIKIQKIKETNPIYPRAYDKIKKESEKRK